MLKVGFKGQSFKFGLGISLGHLSIISIDAHNEFIFKKRIHNTFQIRVDKTQRQQNSYKNKVNFVDYRMK